MEVKALSAPVVFFVDISNVCNLKCPLCPNGKRINHIYEGMMTLSNFVIIWDKIKEYADVINLYNWCEPLLNKEILNIINHINTTKPDCKIQLSTNANVDKNIAIELNKYKIQYLSVSFSGLTQKVYSQYHSGGNIEKVKDFINTLINNNTKNIDTIFIKYLNFPYNFLRYKDIKNEFFKDKIPENFKIQIIGTYPAGTGFSYNEKYEFKDIYRFNKKITDVKYKCDQPYNRMIIASNGDVYPCCSLIYSEKYSLGNIFKESFSDIWYGNRYSNFRKFLSINSNNCCDNCNIITMGVTDYTIKDLFIKTVNFISKKINKRYI